MHKLESDKYLWGYLKNRKGRAYRTNSSLSATANAIDSWLFLDLASSWQNGPTAPPA